MSYSVTQRRFIRPDQPQQVYTKIVDQTVQKWAGIFASQRLAERSRDRANLDLLGVEWDPEFTWALQGHTPFLKAWSPVFGAQRLSERSRDRSKLDLLGADWDPQLGWVTNAIPIPATTAQIYPAIVAAMASLRVPSPSGLLDLTRMDWAPEFTWALQAHNTFLAAWSPVFATELRSERVRDAFTWDPHRREWSPAFSWPFKVVDAVVQTWTPSFAAELKGERVRESFTWDAWRQPWTPQSGWTNRSVDLTTQKWGPAFAQGLKSERVRDRLTQDVRTDWSNVGWITKNVPPVTVTVAQMYPALLQGLSSVRVAKPVNQIDLPTMDSDPEFGWVTQPVSDTVQRWMPAMRSMPQFRSTDGRRYDWRTLFSPFAFLGRTHAPVGHTTRITGIDQFVATVTGVDYFQLLASGLDYFVALVTGVDVFTSTTAGLDQFAAITTGLDERISGAAGLDDVR